MRTIHQIALENIRYSRYLFSVHESERQGFVCGTCIQNLYADAVRAMQTRGLYADEKMQKVRGDADGDAGIHSDF